MRDEKITGSGKIGLINVQKWLWIRPQCGPKDELASRSEKPFVYGGRTEGSVCADIEETRLSAAQVPIGP